LLYESEQLGNQELRLFNELVGVLLEIGVDRQEYKDLVEILYDLWDSRLDSYQYLDWILDILDLLTIYPSGSVELRDRFLHRVQASLVACGRRVNRTHRSLFALLCEDLQKPTLLLDLPEPSAAEADAAEPQAADLTGELVAIYTLEEKAARRAGSLLEQQFPGVRIALCHDHVGSDRLRDLARNAKYFIVATRSAKHAATNFICANRPEGRPPLYPSGKGCTSIVRVLFKHLSEVDGAKAAA